MTVEEWDHVKHWRDPVYGNIFIVLTIFIVRWGALQSMVYVVSLQMLLAASSSSPSWRPPCPCPRGC